MGKEEKTYRNLQEHLDSLPIGYPPTQSGVEIRLLKRLFSPEEAKIATCLSITPEPASRIHERIKKTDLSIDKLQQLLDRMVYKGSIEVHTEGDEKLYRNAVLVVGMFEFQVNRLSPEFLMDMGQYVQEGFGREMYRAKTPQMRTIPVEKSLPVPDKYQVSSYDNVKELIQNTTGQLAVANCICRQMRDLMGERCTKTDLRETCLILDSEQYIKTGLGRPITKEEALDILEKVQEAGLVLQPLNTQRPWAICCCCGDCCGILRSLKQFPRPADYYATNYYAEVDLELCTGCQICVERCQLDAPFMNSGVMSVNLDRCIGCGNCVVICEYGAVQLRKKETETAPPKDMADLYKQIMAEKLGN